MRLTDTVLDRLRSSTREAHQQLEAQLGIMGRLRSNQERPRLIAGYQMLYIAAARLLAAWFDDVEGLSRRVQDGPDDAIGQIELQSRAEAFGFQVVPQRGAGAD